MSEHCGIKSVEFTYANSDVCHDKFGNDSRTPLFSTPKMTDLPRNYINLDLPIGRMIKQSRKE